jgi:hypothetical protein
MLIKRIENKNQNPSPEKGKDKRLNNSIKEID